MERTIKTHKRIRTRWRVVLGLYLVVLIVSHLFQSKTGGMDGSLLPGGDRLQVQIPNRGHDGQIIEDESLRVVYEEFGAWNTGKTPVLLMHGAPGMGTDFRRIAPLLTADGRAVYAPDLVGFAQSEMGENVSYRVQAQHMFAFLDAMGVERVHLVGWSNGGGVGLEMADFAPERIASLTMLASVGAQETEGSGSYFFEHVKYGVGLVGVGYLPDLIPHFGAMGSRDLRIGWLWSFWDSDQRELTTIMETIETPTLILHGRHDFLVSARSAEKHHEMMPNSKLVMLDASHFLPFMQVNETAGQLNAFFDRHDQPGVEPETGYENLAPIVFHGWFEHQLDRVGNWIYLIPWWASMVLIALLVRWRPFLGMVVTMVFVAMLDIDFGVGILGIGIGWIWWLVRGASPMDRPSNVLAWVSRVGYLFVVAIMGMIGGSLTISLMDRFGEQRLGTIGFGVVGFVVGCGLLWVGLRVIRLVISWEGRQRIKAWLSRVTNHEYWPTGLVYITVLWWGLMRMVSGKGLRPLTAVNPGYAPDGGVQGESKDDINSKMGNDPSILQCVLIETDTNLKARIEKTLRAIGENESLGGYPIICKPDRGQRGEGVSLVKNESDIVAFCKVCDEAFVLQRYHAGPTEVGVLWVRHVESITNPDYVGPSGFIYAITIKHFPVLVGDGKNSLRRLIFKHPRHRAQAQIFLTRFVDRLEWIPEKDEELSLGFAGNHAQGAMFTDGSDLITEALSKRVGAIVDGFCDQDGRGFDIGRFDLRCESLEHLSRGEGFGIIELNGITSEPTNLYDPDRSLFWAWGLLLGYWKHVERLSDTRMATNTDEPVSTHEWKRIRRALVKVMLHL